MVLECILEFVTVMIINVMIHRIVSQQWYAHAIESAICCIYFTKDLEIIFLLANWCRCYEIMANQSSMHREDRVQNFYMVLVI